MTGLALLSYYLQHLSVTLHCSSAATLFPATLFQCVKLEMTVSIWESNDCGMAQGHFATIV